MVVIDNSFVISALIENSKEAINFLAECRKNKTKIFVPRIFIAEFSNVLIRSSRKKIIDMREAMELMDMIEESGIIQDKQEHSVTFAKYVLLLAEKYELSMYDAYYLELAMRLKAVLASFDKKLISAAKKAGINVY